MAVASRADGKNADAIICSKAVIDRPEALIADKIAAYGMLASCSPLEADTSIEHARVLLPQAPDAERVEFYFQASMIYASRQDWSRAKEMAQAQFRLLSGRKRTSLWQLRLCQALLQEAIADLSTDQASEGKTLLQESLRQMQAEPLSEPYLSHWGISIPEALGKLNSRTDKSFLVDFAHGFLTLTRKLASAPSLAAPLNAIAQKLSDMGDYRHALEVLFESIRLDPSQAGAYAQRADVERKLGQYDASARDLAVFDSWRRRRVSVNGKRG
jgi:tetratricopeptide (TPR) repeat protein